MAEKQTGNLWGRWCPAWHHNLHQWLEQFQTESHSSHLHHSAPTTPYNIIHYHTISYMHIIMTLYNCHIFTFQPYQWLTWYFSTFTHSCSCLFGVSDRGNRGWYDNPQPALRQVFIAAQCATQCAWGCLYVRVAHGYCHSNNACFVSVRALCCIFYSAQLKLQDSVNARPVCPTPDMYQATQTHPSSQQGHSGLVLWWPDVVHTA